MNYEQSHNFVPPVSEVTAAYADILEHNRKNTGVGAAMANMVLAMVEHGDPDEMDNDNSAEVIDVHDAYEAVSKAQDEAVIAGDMNAELQDIFHGDTFTRIGIRVAPTGGSVASTENRRITSTELKPSIDNTELFTGFLATLTPEEVENDKTPLLADALVGLQNTIQGAFNPKNTESLDPDVRAAFKDKGDDALRTFVAIAPEYERLGLDAKSLREKHAVKPEGKGYLYVSKNASQEMHDQKNAHDTYNSAQRRANTYEDLEKYVTYWGRDLLPEYITAANGQYLTDPAKQGFGPAAWHIDGGQPKWAPAIAFVHKLEQEERTKEFADEVRAGLVRSIDAAVAPVEQDTPDYADGQRYDLGNIRNALTGNDYDASKIMDYTKPYNYS